MHFESELSAGALSLFPLQLQLQKQRAGAAAAIRGGAAIAVAAAKPIGPPSPVPFPSSPPHYLGLVIHGSDSYIIITMIHGFLPGGICIWLL
jgi:hypothetical protein